MTKHEENKIRTILEINIDEPLYPAVEQLVAQRDSLFEIIDQRKTYLLLKKKKTGHEMQEFSRLQKVLTNIRNAKSPSSFSFLKALQSKKGIN